MRPNKFILLIIVILSLIRTVVQSQQSGVKGLFSGPQVSLRTEYLEQPIGLDAISPRFSWKFPAAYQGISQSAYRLVLSTDPDVLNPDSVLYDSGKRVGQEPMFVYRGKKLQPFTRYYWKLQLWDKNGRELPGNFVTFFETGKMGMQNWRGAWISDGKPVEEKAAPYFRKELDLGKPIRSARAYIAAAGLYELSINGSRIGNHRLDPMYTRFDRRNLYVTYDITGFLQQGNNAFGVVLGNGWYNHQSTAVWNFHQAPWRGRPAFCMDIRVEYGDGSVETFGTGKDWKTTATGPLVFNSIYTAEHYDFRKVLPGWTRPGYADTAWQPATLRAAPSGSIHAQSLHPIRNVEELTVKSTRKINDTVFVFDFGRNISGVSYLKAKGQAGTVIRLKHGERLDGQGRVDLSNIDVHYRPAGTDDPFQTDIVTLSGKGWEEFMPSFNYKGFQYVELHSSVPLDPADIRLGAYFMHSDVPAAGWISASEPLIEKIWAATNNSYLSNLFGYPTDCPQREKNGWTGDAHIAIETGLFNFDAITIYEKWLADHFDEQQPNGVLPAIIPTGGWGYEWGNGPDWTSTIAIIPWQVYLFYGDTTLLASSYEYIRRYVDYLDRISPDGICNWGLGDWVPVKSRTPVAFTSTAYYYTDVLILSKAAKLLGHEQDHLRYRALAEKIYEAFNKKFYQPGKGVYGSGLQTELSVALHWGLVPDSLRALVAANLARRVEADGTFIDVGLLGTKTILNALSDNGYAALAYRLATRDTYPSWGWWIRNGATTLYENWPIDAKSDISLNHIMFGEIGAWFYKGLGGIKPDESAPGFRHFRLMPHFPPGLDRFEAAHESPYGKIVSGWTKKGGKLIYRAVVPPNTSATLLLPPGKSGRQAGPVILESGTHELEWK